MLLLHQVGDVYPEWVFAHEQRLVEAEFHVSEVEVEVGEGPRIAVEECGWRSPDDPVQRGDALLPVEQQPHDAWCKLPFTPVARTLGRRGPDEQAADRVAVVQ